MKYVFMEARVADGLERLDVVDWPWPHETGRDHYRVGDFVANPLQETVFQIKARLHRGNTVYLLGERVTEWAHPFSCWKPRNLDFGRVIKNRFTDLGDR